MFDNILLTHDQTIDWLFEVKEKISKDSVTSLFIASLSTNKMEWRSSLAAYSISLNFPFHSCTKENTDTFKDCHVYGSTLFNDPEEYDLSFFNHFRYTLGGGIMSDDNINPCLLAFLLEQHLKMPIVQPNRKDIAIFHNLLNSIIEAKDIDTPNDLEKNIAINKILKSNQWQRRTLLETLGYCNVLQNPKLPGYTFNFTLPNLRRKSDHLSEWNYPIRLWRGSHKLNIEALEFWFSEYL